MYSAAEPVGKIKHFAERVEFQARGSPHIHAVYWVKGAPDPENPENEEQVVAFHDKYISATIPTDNEEMKELILS